MATDIGARIGIDGEAEYKKSISQIIQQSKTLASEMKLVTSSFDKNTSAQDKAEATGKVLAKQIDTQKTYVAALENKLTELSKSYDEDSVAVQKQQEKLNKAKTALNNMEQQMNEAGNEAEEMGKDISKSGEKAEKSKKDFSGLKNTLGNMAKAAASAAAAIGAAVGAAAGKLVGMAKDTATAGDQIDKMSQKLNLSNKAYQQWGYVMSQNGMSIDSMQTGMKKLVNTIDEAKNGSAKATAQFEALGISQSDLANLSTDEIFSKTVYGLQGVSDATSKTAMATDLFGKSATEMLPLLNQSSSETQDLINKTSELGLVMSDSGVNASVAFTDSLDTLQKTFTATKNNVVSQLLPALTSITDGLTGVLSGQEGASEKLTEGFKTLAKDIPNILMRLVDALLPAAEGIFDGLINAFDELAPVLFPKIIGFIGKIGGLVLNNLPTLMNTILNALLTAVESIVEQLPVILPKLIQTVIKIIQMLISNLPRIISILLNSIDIITDSVNDALIQNFPALLKAVINLVVLIIRNLPIILNKLVDQLPKIMETITAVLIDNFPILLAGVVQIVFELIKALPSLILSIGKSLIAGLGGVFSAIGKKMSAWWDSLGIAKAMQNIYNTVVNWINHTRAQVEYRVGLIILSVKGFIWKFKKVGEDIINGLWNGLKNAWNSVSKWFTDTFEGVTKTVKNVLGIHSPSKVFAEIGRFTMEGFAEGVNKSVGGAIKSAKNAFGAVTSSMSMPSLATSAAVGQNSFNITVNAAKNHDVNAVANAVMLKIGNAVNRKGAVFA